MFFYKNERGIFVKRTLLAIVNGMCILILTGTIVVNAAKVAAFPEPRNVFMMDSELERRIRRQLGAETGSLTELNSFVGAGCVEQPDFSLLANKNTLKKFFCRGSVEGVDISPFFAYGAGKDRTARG